MASNPLPKFLEIFCIQKSDGFIRSSELYTVYCKFLAKNKRRVVSKKEFYKYLTSEGYESRKTSKEGIIDNYVENLDWKDLDGLKDFHHFHLFQKIPTPSRIIATNSENKEMTEMVEKTNEEEVK